VDEQARCIVVCTDETGRFDASVTKALDLAEGEGAKVILYDVSAPGSAFSAPRPNEWAGEGAKEEFDRPLDPVALERLGRHQFALQVQSARQRGIDAYGWLPEKFGGDELATYAAQQQADLVLIPADLDDEEFNDYFAHEGATTGIKVERV
jgi:nucleotide-binding universal stress UspA family protein